MEKNTKLYIKIDRHIKVKKRQISLGDVATILCKDKKIEEEVEKIFLLEFSSHDMKPKVVSVMKVLQLIHKKYPDLEIDNQGESEFIVSVKAKEAPLWVKGLKTAIVCLISFAGAAFSIMTFNNDVALNDLFIDIYQIFTGGSSNGFTVLEITYSIGIGLGILVFFNHFNTSKIDRDPTPIQIEMQIYNENEDSTLIDEYTQKGEVIDVD